MENKIEVGKTYRMSGVDVVCIGFTKDGWAKMQTLGIIVGKWPGQGDISDYDDVTRHFANEWKGVINRFELPTLEQAANNELVTEVLVRAGYKFNSFGLYCNVWLGTPDGKDLAWYANLDGCMYCSFSQHSYVVAPAFNLDTDSITLDSYKIKRTNGDKIKRANGDEIKIGKTYKMTDTDVICVGFTKKGYAEMQTIGMTAGKWPGEGNISNYDEITRKFTSEWRGIIKKFRLPTLKQAKKNKWIKGALKEVASNCSSFGASIHYTWLGTVYENSFAWYIGSSGNIGCYGYQGHSYVVAPAFEVDTSNIIVDGDEIKKLDIDDGLNKFLMLDMSILHLSQNTIDKLCTDEEDLGVIAYPKTTGSEHIGLFIRVDKDIVSGLENPDNMPDDLLEIIKFAGKHGCDWINLGPGGAFINDLPMYNDAD